MGENSVLSFPYARRWGLTHTFLVSHPISRSRKRSCQACTSLKVKCDLRQPCSKCRARGRDCIYATEEGQRDCAVGSSNPQQASSSRFPMPVPISNLDASAGFDTSVFGGGATDAFASAFPELSLIEETSNAICQPLSEANLASFGGAPRMHQSAISLPTIDADSDITTSSFQMGGPKHAFTAFGASDVAGRSRALQGYSSTMFEPFFRDVFSVKEETSQEIEQPATPLHTPDAGTFVDGLCQHDFTQSTLDGAQSLDANLGREIISDLMTNVYYDNTQVPHLMQEPSQVPVAASSSYPAPKSASLPNPQPMYPLNPTHEPSKPPIYTQQDLEPFHPPVHSMNISPPDPTTEELQQYRGYTDFQYVDATMLSYSSRLLDRIPSSNSRCSYSDTAPRPQAPIPYTRDAGMRCVVCKDPRCGSIRGEDA